MIYRRKRQHFIYTSLIRVDGAQRILLSEGMLLPQLTAKAVKRTKTMGTENRKRTAHIMVRVSPEERTIISETAAQCRLSVAGFLRELGLGFQPKSIVDYAQVRELARINGDLGRLGGLLKLWLSDDKKMQLYSEKDILKVLEDIETARLELVRTMSRVILLRKQTEFSG